MDPILYELLTTILAAIFFAALAYLRTNYAGVGDKALNVFKTVLDNAKALEAAYPDIRPLNERLQRNYDDIVALWNGNEFTGWNALKQTTEDFYATYDQILAIVGKK